MTDTSKELALARRHFLGRAALAMGGAALGVPTLAAAAAECKLTEPDILGPMYNFGAPFQAKIAADGEPGQRLMLRGTVLSQDCRTPLPHSVVEIWQADDSGQYDKKRPGDFAEPPMPFNLRGILVADAQGRYEIETIIPGAYPIPPGIPGLEDMGGKTRARHIHMRVHPILHVPLTTQLYFAGDPNIPSDPWAKHKPSLVLNPKQDGRYLKSEFNFILATGK